ncbi:hypothetical protein Tco_0746436 [Tanacetum coccineum]
MSSSNYPIIIPSDSDIGDAFSSTHSHDYILASPDYFPASPGNTSSDFLEDLSKYLLALLSISPFHDDLYVKIRENYHGAPDTSYARHVEQIDAILNHIDELPLERIWHSEDKIEGLDNGRVIIQRDFEKLKTEFHEAHTQIVGFQRKQVGHDDEIVLTRIRISTLEMIIEDIQVHHRSDMKSLLDKIYELKNHKGGPSPLDY